MKRRGCFSRLVFCALCVFFACAVCAGSVIYVDAAAINDPGPNNPNISDTNENGSLEHPFDAIQKAINVVGEGGTIIVMPGSYPDSNPDSYSETDFKNKNFTLSSIDPNDWDIVKSTIINGTVYFGGNEGPDCRLMGFKIHNVNYGAIYGENTHATISNCIISGNAPCGATVLMDFDGLLENCLITDNNTAAFCGTYPVIWGCNGIIRNCTIANNISGIAVDSAVIENTIIYNNQGVQLSIVSDNVAEISYSNIEGGLDGIAGYGDVVWGLGNISVEPRFVRLGYWDMQNIRLYEGDYHLKSFGWRINEEDQSNWVFDLVTSRCIDAGNPAYDLKNEIMLAPNDPESDYAVNIRINMGAYGGTGHASLGPYDWSLLADLNNDGVVDFEDILLMAQDWLSQDLKMPGDISRDGLVNMEDYSLLGEIWQKITDWAQ